jgi:hypothetical protein
MGNSEIDGLPSPRDIRLPTMLPPMGNEEVNGTNPQVNGATLHLAFFDLSRNALVAQAPPGTYTREYVWYNVRFRRCRTVDGT